MINPHHRTPSGQPRARSLGIPFKGQPGPFGAITDVPGVEVGYATVVRGADVRTGVTAIHPRGRAGAAEPVLAGWSPLNGNGEMTGTAWLDEAGILALPITITNTFDVGRAHAAAIRWMLDRHPGALDRWGLPVAAETWDGRLSRIEGQHVTEADVLSALEAAAGGPIEEGSVGGGTGMVSFGLKAGSGTASRVVADPAGPFTVGAFVQANFGRRRDLTIAGVPVGPALDDVDGPDGDAGAGSIIVVVATDAPLLPGQCRALARRAGLGVARTGSYASHTSGDLFLAFTTGNAGRHPADGSLGILRFLPWERIDPLYEAVVQAVEEAILNSMTAAEPMTGRGGRVVPALPHERVRALLRDRLG
jgi:L-aminopeptidase/D-esterase-like protein